MNRARRIAWLLGSLLACGDSATGSGGSPQGGEAEGASSAVGASPPEGGGGPASGGQPEVGGGGAGVTSGGGGASSPCAGLASGDPAPGAFQTAGDCKLVLCVNDALTISNDDNDTPADDGNQCTEEGCENGLTTSTITPGADCSAGICADGGYCVQCVSNAECLDPQFPVCSPLNTCVECWQPSDCASPSEPFCFGGACVECTDVSQCPTADCGEAACTAGNCTLDPLAAGTSPSTCFPLVCDGVSLDCPGTCFDDGDCAGQTCEDGACTPSNACDVEWLAIHEPGCLMSPLFTANAGFVGIDENGAIYSDTHVNQLGGVITWDAVRRAADGQVLNTWGGSDGSHNTCSSRLGPMGGFGRGCSYSWSLMQNVSFQSIEYGWGDSLSAGGAGAYVAGGGTIDGANNVFFAATAADMNGVIAVKNNVYDIAGNPLPVATPQVPISPPQNLPAGFDSTLLSQLSSSDLRVDWAGDVTLSGTATGPVDLGGGTLPPLGSLDVVVARFDAGGQHVWSQRFAATGSSATVVSNQFGLTDGTTVVTGDFATADFGLGPLSQSGSDRFIVKLDAAGEPVCSRSIVGTPVTGPSGEILLVRNGAPLVVDGASLGTLPACGGLVIGRLRP